MIQKLEYETHKDGNGNGNVYGAIPSDAEIIAKVNEVIDALNQMLNREEQKEHQFCPDAPKEKSVGGDFYSSHKDMDLDEIAQDYVDRVKQYNPEPTWDLMQTAVCYGYYLAEQKEQRWISVNEKLPPEDEEVIVLTNGANGHTLPIACHLCFAHIVSDRTMFVDYDGWNIPQVRYWMPCPDLPEK